MPEAVKVKPTGAGLGATERRDAWWVGPAMTAGVLGLFVVYATFRALSNLHFDVGPYLSPFYSPNLEEWFGHETRFAFSPAILILWIPAGFRLTCYYYRKAYYRAYFLDPPACSVGEPVRRYHGETRVLLFQNLHRYTLYGAIFINVWLWVDVVRAFSYQGRLGIGMGTLVLLVNTTLLTFYTVSCHSFRHLVGGCRDCFARNAATQLQGRVWRSVSILNERHMLWAWTSLFSVMFADFYVWMVASGTWSDWNSWVGWGDLAVRR